MQKIVPHLWFDTEALEAANFYTTLFDDSKVNWKIIVKDTPSGDSEQLSFTLAGLEFFAISAGPLFTFNPSISLAVQCETVEEVEGLWEKLIDGGHAPMELGQYPFSERYGWLVDRYGLSWQLIHVTEPVKQKIIPSLLFVKEQHGNAEAAINHYVSTFKNSSIGKFEYYGEEMGEEYTGKLTHSSFELEGLQMTAMDGGASLHDFAFNEAISLMVYCENQEEIDYYWEKLSAVPEAEECGWLKDQFGVSWQIAPRELNKLLLSEDEEATQRVVEAFLKMKKMNIAELRRAFKGE